VTISSVNVMTLWTKLESMEREGRFDGAAYPIGMTKFPFRLKGQGFFPGGDGLWRNEGHLSESSTGNVLQNVVVFLGNDFGTLTSYRKLQAKGFENVPTWRHIKKRALAADLPVGGLFFTNTIIGLREEGTALTKQSWKKMPKFAEFCGEFLRFQLQAVKPRLIVVMGPEAHESFDAFAKSGLDGKVLYTTHPYADFSLSAARLAADVAILKNAWQAASLNK
jgi:hypothetical protein